MNSVVFEHVRVAELPAAWRSLSAIRSVRRGSSPTISFCHSLRKGIGTFGGSSRLPDRLISRSVSIAAMVLALPWPARNSNAASKSGANWRKVA